MLGEEQQASSRRAREKSARRRPWRVARRPRALRSRRCAPLGGALRSCPKLGGALLLHEELAPAASATCERSASMAIRPRSWSREHRSDCGEAHALPVAPARPPLPSPPARSRAPPPGRRPSARARLNEGPAHGPWAGRRDRLFFLGVGFHLLVNWGSMTHSRYTFRELPRNGRSTPAQAVQYGPNACGTLAVLPHPRTLRLPQIKIARLEL